VELRLSDLILRSLPRDSAAGVSKDGGMLGASGGPSRRSLRSLLRTRAA
jgi:hypothetical protein